MEPRGGEAIEVTEDGIVGRIRVRLNANLKARTCDEIVAQKKTTHLAAFRFLISELAHRLHSIAAEEAAEDRVAEDPSRLSCKGTVEELIKHIVGLADEVLARQEQLPAMDYTNDRLFKGLVHDMLDTRAMAESTLRIYLEDRSQYIREYLQPPNSTPAGVSLLEGHRRLVAWRARALGALEGAERRAASERLCVLRGLVTERVGETNAAGEDPLVRAAADGAVGTAGVALLLAAGAASGVRALAAAARHGHRDSVAGLLAAGIGVDSRAERVGSWDVLESLPFWCPGNSPKLEHLMPPSLLPFPALRGHHLLVRLKCRNGHRHVRDWGQHASSAPRGCRRFHMRLPPPPPPR